MQMSHERGIVTISARSESTQFDEDREAMFSAQLEKVLNSDYFRNSHTARRLLEYIVTRSMDGRQDDLKEFTIGVEVLGRKPDFDPKIDTIVRVQIHRLRQKLADYYATEGVRDPVRISIPRGSYHAEFTVVERPPVIEPVSEESPAETAESVNHEPVVLKPEVEDFGKTHPAARISFNAYVQQWNMPLVLFMLVCVSVFAGYFLGRNHGAIQAKSHDTPVERLWLQMVGNDANPIIGYPSDVHLLDESNDMFSFGGGAVGRRGSEVDSHVALQFAANPELVAHSGTLYYDDGYTGTGELESVGMLVGLLHDLGLHPTVKRLNEITSQDVRDHNVIMLGSGSFGRTHDDLPGPGDFQITASRHGAWNLSIANLHPQRGELESYKTERDANTKTVLEDYAIISYQPGIVPERHIIILGGLDTTGTAGATSFLNSTDGAQMLLDKMASRTPGNRRLPFFQAVVHCIIKDGDDVSSTKVAAVHVMPWKAR